MVFPTLKLNIERWKFNKEAQVYVSNMGHFKNIHKEPLPIAISQTGYCSIKTPKGYKKAHRLVLETWCPTPEARYLTVDHLDHNKRNNALSNLEWVTQEENQKRAKQDFIPEAEENKYNIATNPIPANQKVRVNGTVVMTQEELEKFVMAPAFCAGTSPKQKKAIIHNVFTLGKTKGLGLNFELV